MSVSMDKMEKEMVYAGCKKAFKEKGLKVDVKQKAFVPESNAKIGHQLFVCYL